MELPPEERLLLKLEICRQFCPECERGDTLTESTDPLLPVCRECHNYLL